MACMTKLRQSRPRGGQSVAGPKGRELVMVTAHETRYDARDTIREASLTSNQRHSFSRTPKWNSTLRLIEPVQTDASGLWFSGSK